VAGFLTVHLLFSWDGLVDAYAVADLRDAFANVLVAQLRAAGTSFSLVCISPVSLLHALLVLALRLLVRVILRLHLFLLRFACLLPRDFSSPYVLPHAFLPLWLCARII